MSLLLLKHPIKLSSFCCCLVTKSCLTLYNSMDCSSPGFSICGISQAMMLEWVAISFPRISSWPRDRTWVSCIVGGVFTTEPPLIPNNSIQFPRETAEEVQVSVWIIVCLHMREFLSVHMSVSMSICICSCVYTYEFVYMSCVHAYGCVFVCICLCKCGFVSVSRDLCVSACTSVCVCISVCVHADMCAPVNP